MHKGGLQGSGNTMVPCKQLTSHAIKVMRFHPDYLS
jgi:hypothetical protein